MFKCLSYKFFLKNIIYFFSLFYSVLKIYINAIILLCTIFKTAGLLVVTGMLWGCTNPFIRQGTRGLRKVHAETRLGQAYAEIIFLLGNWRYVMPWLVNQGGSLVYLSAVQKVPLSLAVPTANSLAFAFTALTGATLGTEEPLDRGSIAGIMLIAVGTTLCCWDKVD